MGLRWFGFGIKEIRAPPWVTHIHGANSLIKFQSKSISTCILEVLLIQLFSKWKKVVHRLKKSPKEPHLIIHSGNKTLSHEGRPPRGRSMATCDTREHVSPLCMMRQQGDGLPRERQEMPAPWWAKAYLRWNHLRFLPSLLPKLLAAAPLSLQTPVLWSLSHPAQQAGKTPWE